MYFFSVLYVFVMHIRSTYRCFEYPSKNLSWQLAGAPDRNVLVDMLPITLFMVSTVVHLSATAKRVSEKAMYALCCLDKCCRNCTSSSWKPRRTVWNWVGASLYKPHLCILDTVQIPLINHTCVHLANWTKPLINSTYLYAFTLLLFPRLVQLKQVAGDLFAGAHHWPMPVRAQNLSEVLPSSTGPLAHKKGKPTFCVTFVGNPLWWQFCVVGHQRRLLCAR